MSVIINNFGTLSIGFLHRVAIKCCTLDMPSSADIYPNTYIAQSTIRLDIHSVCRDTSRLIKATHRLTNRHAAISLRSSPTCTKRSIAQHGFPITGITRTWIGSQNSIDNGITS